LLAAFPVDLHGLIPKLIHNKKLFRLTPVLLTGLSTPIMEAWLVAHASEVILGFSHAYTRLLQGLSAGFSTLLSTNKKAGIVIPACSYACPHVYPQGVIWAF
jgi:hypothetical protein